MIDYVSFLGIAAYLALTSTGFPRTLRMRVPLLVGALAFNRARRSFPEPSFISHCQIVSCAR
jgi:hypothetical protein